MEPTSDSIRERLAAALPQAQREQDSVAVRAIGSAVAAIENAAAGEASDRDLSESDLLAIVLAEATDREAEAADQRGAGHHEAADLLAAGAAYLREFTV